ncbi:MAG TPA: IPT/TIG domain-containing protein, partial [Cyclobacteriaceae bacterium]|nr:IPT/TIG domain-containing protein [Cyclobacteriaceae bacterium]
SDNGGVWADANGSLSYPSPRCFFANSSTVLVGTYGGGIFKTTDQGLHWSSSNSGLMSNGFIYSMAYDGTTLFAGTPKGVIKSTDLGANWTTANTGISNTIVLALAASNGKVFASISGGGVYLSSDNGTSWSAVNTGLSNTDVRSLLISGSNILAGTAQGLFKSSDNGSNWSAVNGITVNNVWSLISFGSSLYAATDNGVFKSIDNGASWVATSTGLPSSTPVGSITVAQNTLFAGTNNGVYFSANNGASWANGNDGLTGIPKALLANGSYVYAGIDGTSVYTRAISNFNPTITSISPISGPVGTSVTIKGTNFDFNAANDSVSINGLRVSVSGAGKTSMIITIPDGATTGKIGLSVAGLKTTSGQTFTVIQPPTITGFTPASGKAGESVTITGTNFDVSAANNIVKFNGKAAAIVGTPTSTNIVATIPSDASTGLITVTTNGITATSSSPFTVNVVTGDISKAPDNTTFVYPNPSTNYVYFSSDLDVQSSVQVNIFDSKGLSIEKLPYEVVSAKELRMDVSSLTSGLYVAKISVQDKIFHLKFVKENAK